MARRRYVSTEMSLDKALSRVAKEHGDFATLLYTWLIPHAQDDCTIPRSDDPEELLAMVLPFRRDITAERCSSALSALISEKLLMMQDDGLLYFPADAFYRYQTYIPEHKRRGQSGSEKRRETAKNAEERRATPQIAALPSPSPSKDQNTSSSKPADDAFDAFWEAYPKKVGKKAAKAAWKKAVKEANADTITASLASYEFDTRDGGQFIPHPATWLNQGRWEDERIPFLPEASDDFDAFLGKVTLG